ncbi:MAG: hypothetical protein JSS64_02750 [Bacteroidetes bacterium]|nr:hypothetical protein [Bacteroidota bacterium]
MNINQLVAIQLSVLRLDKNRTLESLVHDTGIGMASMSRLENGKKEIASLESPEVVLYFVSYLFHAQNSISMKCVLFFL